jgi:hypothetical protein
MPYIIGSASQPRFLDMDSGNIQSGIVTTSTTSPTALISLSASAYRSVKYQIQVTEGSNYSTTNISAFHDGTNAFIVEYGSMKNNIDVSTFDVDVNAGQFRLIGYPASSNLTTFKIVYTSVDL